MLPLTLLSLAMPGPAAVKGATDVVVSGPGVDDVHLAWTRRAGDVDVMTLADASGLYLVYGASPPFDEDELGPRYQLEWATSALPLSTSYAYPFSRRAWVRHAAGGWARGGPQLRRQLVALGASETVASAEAVWLTAYRLARGVWATVHGIVHG